MFDRLAPKSPLQVDARLSAGFGLALNQTLLPTTLATDIISFSGSMGLAT